MSNSVHPLDELQSASAAQPPVHALASARVDAGEAPDAEAIATMRAPELIGGDVTNDVQTLRWIWWQHHGLGFTYPPESGIIVLEGGRP